MTLHSRRNRTTAIVVHCSATRASQDIGAKEIRSWHRDRGFTDIGYHYIIRRNGEVEIGRPLWAVGAHVSGNNSETVGICLVGGLNDKTGKAEMNYTTEQMASLVVIIGTIQKAYPEAQHVLGHRDYSFDKNKNGVIDVFERMKECPCFDVIPWWDTIQDEKIYRSLARTYTVVAGDTYWKIARRFDVDLNDLVEANPQAPHYSLQIGTVLNLPV